MVVRLKKKQRGCSRLTLDHFYYVFGIDCDDYRILNDSGDPCLYPPKAFEVVDPHEPVDWVTKYGDEGERYSYPPELDGVGFFEDYHDKREDAVATFWHAVNKRLSGAP